MRERYPSLSIFVVTLLCLGAVQMTGANQALQDMLKERENEVDELYTTAVQEYKRRCTTLSRCSTSSCSLPYNERTSSIPHCGTQAPNAECSAAFGDRRVLQMCDGRPCEAWERDRGKDLCRNCPGGLMLDFNEAFVMFPPGADQSALAESLCWMHKMNEKYVQIDQARRNSGQNRVWSFTGEQTSGIMQLHPGFLGLGPSYRDDNGCKTGHDEIFKTQLRPWYVAAASGPKDVILVLDISGSMARPIKDGSESRLEVMKRAAKTVLGTLTHADKVAVVAYSSNAVVLSPYSSTKNSWAGSLKTATNETIAGLRLKIDNLRAFGETYYTEAFDRVKHIFRSQDEGGCRRVVLFLTDGACTPASCGGLSTEDIIKGGSGEALPSDVIIFSYTIGDNLGQSMIPRQMACIRQGIYQHIPVDRDLVSVMTEYYQYLAAGTGSGPNASLHRWSTPYEDGGGLGKMVSVARPVFDVYHMNGISEARARLVAVVGTDVLLSSFDDIVSDSSDIVMELVERSRYCAPFSLSNCALQQLRATVEAEDCATSGTCSVCMNGTDPDVWGSSYPELGDACPVEQEGITVRHRCPIRKTSDDALCQSMDIPNMKPNEAEFIKRRYYAYVCCPGCVSVITLVGVLIPGVFIVLWAAITEFENSRFSRPKTFRKARCHNTSAGASDAETSKRGLRQRIRDHMAGKHLPFADVYEGDTSFSEDAHLAPDLSSSSAAQAALSSEGS